MNAHSGIAQARSRLDQGVEYRLQIEGRAADNLEHVSGGGLLLQRFAQILRTLREVHEAAVCSRWR